MSDQANAQDQQQRFGRYEIKSELGRGGMATVYFAYDPRFGRDVAIKVLPREFLHEPTFRARFEREARTVAVLEHPAIVPVYDFGEENGQPFIVMRYMSGGSLADRLKKGALPVNEAVQIVQRLAQALDAAHARGVVHRDLKPGNVMFDQYGNAFLSDFGIARLTASGEATLTGSGIVGTPTYMSPEQIQGAKDLDGRADIYALGVIFYQMLTGNVPYQGDTPIKVMMMHLTEPVPHLQPTAPTLAGHPALPVFDQVVGQAMAKDPKDRYPTAGALAGAAETVLRQTAVRPPVAAPPVSPQATLTEPPAAAAPRAAMPTPTPAPPQATVTEPPVAAPITPPPAPARPATAPQPTPAGLQPAVTRPPATRRRGLSIGLVIGGVAALCLVLAGLGVGGAYLAGLFGPAPTAVALATATQPIGETPEPGTPVITEVQPAEATATPGAGPETPVPPTPVPTAGPTKAEGTAPAVYTPFKSSYFQTPHIILSDVRVRRAMAYCTDKTALLLAAYPNLKTPEAFVATTVLPPTHWAYAGDNPALTAYAYNPQAGEKLLEEAGWTLPAGSAYRKDKNGRELALTLSSSTAALRQAWTAAWEAQLKTCGIRLVRELSTTFITAEDGLAQRNFELAGFAWQMLRTPFDYRQILSCSFIPFPENQWTGKNYSGWCNEKATWATTQLATRWDRQGLQEAFYALQQVVSEEVPVLPLFWRPQVQAWDSQLERMVVEAPELYSWNAYEWRLPNADQIVIGMTAEPASLFQELSQDLQTQVMNYLFHEPLYTYRNFQYQPGVLTSLPSVDNGGVQVQRVTVKQGEKVVNLDMNQEALQRGTQLVNAEGYEITYGTGTVEVNQLAVTFQVVKGLTWSDGQPVKREDFELGYKAACKSNLREYATYLCNVIKSVDFIDDTTFKITYYPGYTWTEHQVPPFGAYPAHQQTSKGRLGDVAPADWASLKEITETPLGYGPYVPVQWTRGKEIIFQANPYYWRGAPAEKQVVVRFVAASEVAGQLVQGKLDVVGSDALSADALAALYAATQQGSGIQLKVTPSGLWEHVEFGLYIK
jgi:serine/threonine protein kinase/ABC-type transport system substrate-binding protein